MFELLFYYAHRRRKYKRTAIRLKGSLLDCRLVVEDESLCVMDKFSYSRRVTHLNPILAEN